MQRGAIKQHGKFWVLKFREDVLQNGSRVRKDVYKKLAPIGREYQTKESVQPLADLILAPLNAGVHQAQSVDTIESYLESFVAKGQGGSGRELQQSTLKNYTVMLNLVRPHLTPIELRQVRTPYIDKLLRAVAANDGENRRAHTTYRNLKNFLSSAFKFAVRDGLVEFNPVREAAIPEGEEADTHAYSLREVRTIMDGLKKPMAKSLVMLATFTGLRSEEIKGLRWDDYENGVLDIKRAISAGKVVELKTKASKAPVPVVKTVQKTLAAHLKQNSGDGYIFHGNTGEPLDLENFAQRDIKPVLEKAGVEWHGYHAFRRGLASVLHELGVAELTIKHILRHSDSDVTRKHYIKSSTETNRKALELVEKQYLKQRLKRR
ncbi:MAG TPA: tyrosine-type recombinase/integrase [Candidatus Dormibacteraeota bacterium]|nr:tyrosine-type recombinase/integrase [Candidatus Dormibacteraeota bacterium]